VVLMDLVLPGMSGVEAVRRLRDVHPDVKVVVLTSFAGQETVLPAVRAGAAGYLLKDATRAEVVGTIWQALDGDALLNPGLATRLLQRLATETPRAKAPQVPLTPRESEVLQLLSQGRTNRQIAGELVIAPGTAKLYVERILGKLGVSDRTQAAVRAVELGLVTPTPD